MKVLSSVPFLLVGDSTDSGLQEDTCAMQSCSPKSLTDIAPELLNLHPFASLLTRTDAYPKQGAGLPHLCPAAPLPCTEPAMKIKESMLPEGQGDWQCI